MGFLDELDDVFTDPLSHPFEAAMIMSMMDDEEDEDEDFDDLYDDYDDIDLDNDVTEDAYSWREDADDGEFCGLDPEDYESEEEYEFELNWAETIQELLEEAGEKFGADVDSCSDLEELKDEVYPRMDLWELLAARYDVPFYFLDEDTFEQNVAMFYLKVGENLPEVINFMELPLEGFVPEEEFFDACSEMSSMHIHRILAKMDKSVLLDDLTLEKAKNLDVKPEHYLYLNAFRDELLVEEERQRKMAREYGVDRDDYTDKKSFVWDIKLLNEHFGSLYDSGDWKRDREEVKAERRQWLEEYKAKKQETKTTTEKKQPEQSAEVKAPKESASKKEPDRSGSIPPKPERLQGIVSDEIWEQTVRETEKKKQDKFFERVSIIGAILIPIILNASKTPFFIIVIAEIVWIGIMIGVKMNGEKQAADQQGKTAEQARGPISGEEKREQREKSIVFALTLIGFAFIFVLLFVLLGQYSMV